MVLVEIHQQQVIIVTARTTVHTHLDVMVVKDVYDIPKNVCNIDQ